ncbi:hypothetical protein [Paenibacillus pinihumi]|uniref:hypothetical protein n=1 Tax=Paenibacillus pinihumi TaxID=669462 RepID=UPI00041F82B4|nr:hypothetical protein [Paenibacillus pinihumi]
MAKVIAPNSQYTGLSASVMFVKGVGETDDEYLLGWFEEKGYTVERSEPEFGLSPEDPPEGDPPADPEPEVPAAEPEKSTKKGK